MRYATVCSGIEAPSAAWHPLGWEPVFFSEIEPFPCAVLKHHYPDVPNLGDMTKFKEWPDAAFDVLCGGTPCQSFSVAGLRKGLDDPRGNLALVFLAIARRYAPRWVVWENVPGVLSDNTNAFGQFVAGLLELGYGVCWRVLDAQHFGVPQRRRRVFVVGCLGDWRAAAAVLFERHSLQGHPPPSREKGQGFAERAGASAAISSGRGWWDESETGATIRAQDSVTKADTLIAHSLRADGFDASEDGTGRGTPLVPHVAPTLRAGGNQTGGDRPPGTDVDTCDSLVPLVCPALKSRDYKGPSSDGDGDGAILVPVAHVSTMPTMRAAASQDGPGHAARSGDSKDEMIVPMTLAIRGRGDSHDLEYRQDGTANAILTPNGGRAGIGVGAVAFAQNQRDEVRQMDVAGALAGEPGMKQQTYLRQAMQVRRLTPRECERLQGFPDDYTQVPYRNKPAADGPRYKALGNSMAVPVVRWIGERIAMVEKVTG